MPGKRRMTTSKIARIAVLGAIASILFFFPEIPIIGFYQLDFSTLPALLGGFAMGPIPGIFIVMIKDFVGMMHSSSAYVGELADFICSGVFVGVASLCYMRRRTFKSAVVGMALGVVAIVIAGVITNLYIMIPFYVTQMGFPEADVINMFRAIIPQIDSIGKVVAFVTAPFNLLKGVVLSVLAILLYKRLGWLLHGRKKSA